MIAFTVQEFLRRGNVAYTVFQHRPAFTAQEEAAVTHVPGRNLSLIHISEPTRPY